MAKNRNVSFLQHWSEQKPPLVLVLEEVMKKEKDRRPNERGRSCTKGQSHQPGLYRPSDLVLFLDSHSSSCPEDTSRNVLPKKTLEEEITLRPVLHEPSASLASTQSTSSLKKQEDPEIPEKEPKEEGCQRCESIVALTELIEDWEQEQLTSFQHPLIQRLAGLVLRQSDTLAILAFKPPEMMCDLVVERREQMVRAMQMVDSVLSESSPSTTNFEEELRQRLGRSIQDILSQHSTKIPSAIRQIAQDLEGIQETHRVWKESWLTACTQLFMLQHSLELALSRAKTKTSSQNNVQVACLPLIEEMKMICQNIEECEAKMREQENASLTYQEKYQEQIITAEAIQRSIWEHQHAAETLGVFVSQSIQEEIELFEARICSVQTLLTVIFSELETPQRSHQLDEAIARVPTQEDQVLGRITRPDVQKVPKAKKQRKAKTEKPKKEKKTRTTTSSIPVLPPKNLEETKRLIILVFHVLMCREYRKSSRGKVNDTGFGRNTVFGKILVYSGLCTPEQAEAARQLFDADDEFRKTCFEYTSKKAGKGFAHVYKATAASDRLAKKWLAARSDREMFIHSIDEARKRANHEVFEARTQWKKNKENSES
ncbi:MAG: hypothetical protein UU08_C0017G0013 [Candidatus Uhrbacteria bacterium GW2011_GWE2_40_58]|nr:MAG: hypothetical protein UT94_C0019G0013 [Candidatus Uhrbacteria bacterium GW2011_GWF2_40_263]KKR67454.1 MAG: hypothetical protein UU08_C0017G0013 [Candidatus Uhrbacteria bacterium GW2011_GWE2_40_58]OGL94461.1 MAG: hypothetical protein A2239_01215 [Candidatus Uhrbacteria bacterium RIFOXYA2_FULL_40_9]OGL98293.1 MAG: hypothetical protein A2332_05050 [Candidatus Uhrbacteria bacterium RIFOXYB2_FULL_41_18]HCB55705.1 hypothetical protein [Candidatus Uhrbacteria bacterium]